MTRWTARWIAVPLLAAGLLISGPVPALATQAGLPAVADLVANAVDVMIGGPAIPEPRPFEVPEPVLSVLPR